MLVGIAFGILVGAWSAGISFLIMRNHTEAVWGAIAYVGASVSGFAIAMALLAVLAATSSSHAEFNLMADGFFGTAMFGVVVGSSSGLLESYVFARRHPPSGRVASRNGQTVVEITGLRMGSRQMITLEMSEPEWSNLQAVRDVLLDQLRRHRLPAEPSDATSRPASAGDAPSTGAYNRSTPWIFVTGRRRDTGELATITVTTKRWLALSPLQWVVKKALRRRGAEPRMLRDGWLDYAMISIQLAWRIPLFLVLYGGTLLLLSILWPSR
jgi:hypothetical protein